MARPLTVSDRLRLEQSGPQVGDVLVSPLKDKWFVSTVDQSHAWVRFTLQQTQDWCYGFTEIGHWAYVSRADGGPITTDDTEPKEGTTP